MNKRSLLVLSMFTLLSGSGLTWQAQAGSLISWERLTDATVRAAREPSTWAPLAAAAVIGAGNWDHQWQSSLSKHQSVFGGDAEDESNALVTTSTVLYAVSTLMAAPREQSFSESVQWKAVNVGVMLADKTLIDGMVTEWKKVSNRDRPDGVAGDAFPSKHNATVATQSTLTRRNLDYIDIDPALRKLAKIGLYGIDGLTGIARMEADKHYPTDVLVGMALGNFLANLSYNLFLEKSASQTYSLALVPTTNSLTINTQFIF